MDTFGGCILIWFLAIVCSIVSLFTNANAANAYSLLIRHIHYIAFLYMTLFLIIFNPPQKETDITYMIAFVLLICHWYVLKNECILNYLDKLTYNKNYKLGDNPYDNDYLRVLFLDKTDLIMNICKYIWAFTLWYVMDRNLLLTHDKIVSLCVLFALFLFVTLNNFHR